MKKLFTVLSLLLAILLLSNSALAETYTDDWGNGITLNFELDDFLLQPLDIFDTIYWLDPHNPTNEELADAKSLLQKAMEITFNGDIPEIKKDDDRNSLYLMAYKNNFGEGEYAYYNLGSISTSNEMDGNYSGSYNFIYNDFSVFNNNSVRTYLLDFPATRDDFFVEHDFMTHDEADAKARAFMTAMRGEDSPFDVVLREWYGITHEQVADVVHFVSEHDDIYEYKFKTDFDNWTDVYDLYYLLYSYTYKGYPICDWVQTMYSRSMDSPIKFTGYDTECLINREGFVRASEHMLFDCDYTPYEDTPALTLYEALDVLKQYLDGIKGLNPIQISRVYVEYLPHYTGGDSSYKRTFEPIWSFVADMTTDYGVLEEYMVYRVNGHTGEIMTNGTGVIE